MVTPGHPWSPLVTHDQCEHLYGACLYDSTIPASLLRTSLPHMQQVMPHGRALS